MRVLLSVVAFVLMSTGAQAQVYHGNDTGGIIPWSCENEAVAQQVAAAYCARWDKYHRITSVHRHYGELHRLQLPLVAARQPLCAAGRAHAVELPL